MSVLRDFCVGVILLSTVACQGHYGYPGYSSSMVPRSPGSSFGRLITGGEPPVPKRHDPPPGPSTFRDQLFNTYGPPTSGPSFGFGGQFGGSGSMAHPPPSSYGPPSQYAPNGPSSSRFKIIPAHEFKIPQEHTNLIRYIVLKEFQIGPNGSAVPLQTSLGRNKGGNGSPELEIMKVQMPGSGEDQTQSQYGPPPATVPKVKASDSNSIEDDEIRPVKAVDLSNSNRGSAHQAYLFSDSGERQMENRAGGSGGGGGYGGGNSGAVSSGPKSQRGSNEASGGYGGGTSGSAASTGEQSPPPVDELQNALQVLAKYFNAQASFGGRQQGAAAPGGRGDARSGSYGQGTPNSDAEMRSLLPSATPPPPPPHTPAPTSATTEEPTTTTTADSGPQLVVIPDPTDPEEPQFPSQGGGGSSGGSSGGIISTVVGLKSSALKGVASTLTKGFQGVAKTVSSVASGVAAAKGFGSSSSGSTSPLRTVLGLKGAAVRTVANTGRAALGIAGVKGKLVVNQVGTVTKTVTNGVAETVNNKNDAFQDVIKHIQSIFNSNKQRRSGESGEISESDPMLMFPEV